MIPPKVSCSAQGECAGGSQRETGREDSETGGAPCQTLELDIPSGSLLHRYWKWPFIVSFPINSMVIFHSYVSLPEDYGKIYRKALYLMVKTMVSCKFSLEPIQWYMILPTSASFALRSAGTGSGLAGLARLWLARFVTSVQPSGWTPMRRAMLKKKSPGVW